MKRANDEGNIRKRGQFCWEGSVMIGGRRRYVYGKSSQEVRKKIAALALQADLGLYVDESDMLLRDWLTQWIESYINVKESTFSRYMIDVEQHIAPALGNIPLCDLRTTHIQMFYNRMLKSGMSAKSLKNLHGVLHEALERAVMINLISKNVSNACVLPRVKQAEMHPLTDEDVPRFLDAIRNDPFNDVFFVALFTGMRQGEILGLTWDNISFDQQTILISHQLQRVRKNREYHFTDVKNRKTRIIQPAPEVMAVLKRIQNTQKALKDLPDEDWRNESNLVFVNKKGRHLSCMTVYHHFKVIADSIGRPEMRFHDLRHSYALLTLMTGGDYKTLSVQMGHATTAFTLDRYGHTTDRMRQDAADRMSTYIQSLAGKK